MLLVKGFVFICPPSVPPGAPGGEVRPGEELANLTPHGHSTHHAVAQDGTSLTRCPWRSIPVWYSALLVPFTAGSKPETVGGGGEKNLSSIKVCLKVHYYRLKFTIEFSK